MRRHARSDAFGVVATVVIAITTTVSHHDTSVPAIINTWGRDFKHLYFFSERRDDALKIVPVKIDPTKARASAEELAGLRHLAETHPDAPWYYKADDDAYVHAARLSDLATAYDPTQPWYIGQSLDYNRDDGTLQEYCAGGVGYLISNALMKLLYPRLTEPITSCCSDVHVGALVQAVLNKTDGDSICHTPADSYAFHAAGTVLHPAPAGPADINKVLPGFVYNESVVSTLRTAVGFHYVSYLEQYVLRSLYQHVDRLGIRKGHLAHTPADTSTTVEAAVDNGAQLYGHPGSLADPTFNWHGTCGVAGFKCVISYGLYGNNTRYTTGAVRNAAMIGSVFPGWVARFYYDTESVPEAPLDKPRSLYAEVGPHDWAKTMFARFLVASDNSVDRYMVRDADSRLGLRERAAVDEWIASGYSMHYLRDHPAHGRAINGGMWGGVKGAVADMVDLVASTGIQRSSSPDYGDDQDFLSAVVYPRTVHDQIAHDSISCTGFSNSVSFPTQRIGAEHVGMVFDAAEAPRMGDMSVFFTDWTNNPACRRRPAWVKG